MFRAPSLTSRVSRRGTVVALVAICLTIILGVLALALDGGTMFAERRHAQAAADAAAMAAACDLYYNYWTNNGKDPSGTAAKSATDTAAANGYTSDGTTCI